MISNIIGEDYKWISFDELKKDIQEHGEKYTAWFKIIVKKLDESGMLKQERA